MHHWQIKKNNRVWLCNACMRQLTDVIMLGTWKWLDEVKDIAICCDRCKCNDYTVEKFGRYRKFFRFFAQNHLRSTGKLKAYRRAIY